MASGARPRDIYKPPCIVRFIKNKMFVGMKNRVEIFDSMTNHIKQWSNTACGFVNDVSCIHDKSVVLICRNGLFNVDTNGKVITQIDSGDYKSGAYHDGKLFVSRYNSNIIITYAYNRSWKKYAKMN